MRDAADRRLKLGLPRLRIPDGGMRGFASISAVTYRMTETLSPSRCRQAVARCRIRYPHHLEDRLSAFESALAGLHVVSAAEQFMEFSVALNSLSGEQLGRLRLPGLRIYFRT